MRTTVIKIIVVIGIILITTLIGIGINGGKSGSGSNRAPIFVMIGAIVAIRAVWKYNPEKRGDTSVDKKELDKTE